jgi:hypothetical protein
LGARPAPDTPLAASTMTGRLPCPAVRPTAAGAAITPGPDQRGKGQDGGRRVAARGGDQLGRPAAPRGAARVTRTRTAQQFRACMWSCPYQVGYSPGRAAGSRRPGRRSRPPRINSGTRLCDCPWGRARNTRSRPSSSDRGRRVAEVRIGGGQRRRVLGHRLPRAARRWPPPPRDRDAAHRRSSSTPAGIPTHQPLRPS